MREAGPAAPSGELPNPELEPPTGPRRPPLLRFAPLAVALLALILVYALGLYRYLSFEALRHDRGDLAAFVAAYPVRAALLYVVTYIAVVVMSFPGAGFMTITGGFLFGTLAGGLLASVAAITGATAFFLMARTSLGAWMAARAGPRTQRLRRGFQEEGFSYVLFLRLVPLFPFWLINLAAALFGMRLLPYVAATVAGVVPPTFVFAYFGRGLASALESDRPQVPIGLAVALALLGLLALLPVLVRRLRKARPEGGG